ncbi:MAG: ketol-acid reductoisomerase [Nocardioidaceae bacterium]
MATLFHDDHADLGVVQDRHVAVLGYGSQGHAQALSLRDSGVDVRVGLPEASASRDAAEAQGLRVVTPAEACEEADLITVLVPDPVQRRLYTEAVLPNLVPGDALLFSHGFSIRFGYIVAPEGVDVVLVAPRAPGDLVRREYVDGRGVPVLVAVEVDATGRAWELALSYAKAIGGLRAGAISTTFSEETETYLFGAQAVLRGGVRELVMKGFETLTEAGYQPEVAFLECLNELKQVVDLMSMGGLASRRRGDAAIAEYGGYLYGPRVVDGRVRAHMTEVLDEIVNGTFAERYVGDQDAGAPELAVLRQRAAAHPIEQVGGEVRAMMAWLDSADSADSDDDEGSAAR